MDACARAVGAMAPAAQRLLPPLLARAMECVRALHARAGGAGAERARLEARADALLALAGLVGAQHRLGAAQSYRLVSVRAQMGA